MAIRQEFKFTPAEGTEFVDINTWITTLSAGEQEEWKEAVTRQHAIRSQYINNGQLQIDKSDPNRNSYIWDENLVGNKPKYEYKEYDDVWLAYWNRYLTETGTTFEIVETKI